MGADALAGGFVNPSHQSAYAFRAIMNGMARPGSIQKVDGAQPPAPMSDAAGAVLLTLCDRDTGIYLAGAFDCVAVRRWIAFHIGAPIVQPSAAAFALGRWADLAVLDQFAAGTAEYPDRSTTLIVEQADEDWAALNLRGPGIRDDAKLALPELEPFQENHRRFPLGCDFIFTQGDHLSALPRSTEVTACMSQ